MLRIALQMVIADGSSNGRGIDGRHPDPSLEHFEQVRHEWIEVDI